MLPKNSTDCVVLALKNSTDCVMNSTDCVMNPV